MANRIRRRDLQAVYEAGTGHIGGEMSVIDLECFSIDLKKGVKGYDTARGFGR
jgi:transketolase N-terminal domain/subunit